MKRGPRVEGELGGGVWMGETEEITVHEINILVAKGINKVNLAHSKELRV